AGAKRVFLDNVANYPKTPMEQKLLGGILGEGLLVSEGEKWKSHRRLMAPSFDFRSLISYAPMMVDQAEKMAAAWAARMNAPEIDIADEMTKITLQIISRTMFSADGDALGELVDHSLRKTTDHMDFNIFDMLPVIGPPLLKRKMDRIHEGFAAMD